MDVVGAYEAKTHFSQLLDRVARGETITIQKHGVPVALLQPVEKGRQMTAKDAIQRMKELRKGNRPGGLSIREMIEEGRK